MSQFLSDYLTAASPIGDDPVEAPPAAEIVVDRKSGLARQAGADTPEGAWVLGFKLRAERSLYVFCKGVLGRQYLTVGLHRPICQFIQTSPPRRKGVLLPREHGKTSLVSHGLPIHILLQPKDGNIYFPGEDGADQRIILIGETETRATDAMRVIQSAFEMNDTIRALWPHRVWDNPRRESKKWNERECIIPRPAEYPDPSIRAIGVGGAVTGAHPTCLVEGTLIYTSNGLVPIESIQPSMRVLTKTGHHREVIATQSRPASVVTTVSLWGQPVPIRCTPEHQWLVSRSGSLMWIEARDLVPWDLMALPIPEGRTRAVSRANARVDAIVNNAECWRLLGYWLAEGAASPHNVVRLTFGKHEAETYAADAARIVRDHLGVQCSLKVNRKTAVVSFSDADFKSVTRKFGTHAYNKHVPPFAVATKRHFRVEMVRGYFRGDGHRRTVGWGVTSVSPSLLAGMQLVLASLDIPSALRVAARPRVVTFPDGVYATKTAYVLQSNHPLMDLLMGTEAHWPTRPCRATLIPGYLLSPIRRVETRPESATAYDIQVAKDESFVVFGGGCAHNCLIKDDLVTLEAANSPIVMQTAIEWHIASRALINSERSLEFIIGTRWAVNDLYEYIMRNDPTVEWTIRSIVENGAPIYPETFSLEKVAQLQREFGVLFPLLYMNSALARELVDFDMEMIREFEIVGDRLRFSEDDRDLALSERLNAPAPSAVATAQGAPLTRETWQAIYRPGEGIRLRG